MPIRLIRQVLLGNATVGDVETGKSFYNNDANSKLTGTGSTVFNATPTLSQSVSIT